MDRRREASASPRRQAARRRADQRGAVAVESALVLPLLLVLVFGIVEISMLLRDHVAVTAAARAGARVAAAAPAAGACVSDAQDDATPCPASSVPEFAQQAANAIARSGTALPKASIKSIIVYKANANGYPGAATELPRTCSGASNCVVYTWRPSQNRFRWTSGTWDSRTVSACFPAAVDTVGVEVIADHRFLSGLLGTAFTMTDYTVMNFEPLPPVSCASGAHP